MAELAHDSVLIVSFGGPEGVDDVLPFLENVTRGRGVPRERLAEVGAHYAHFGGVSPLNAHVRALAGALQRELAEHGPDLPVYVGHRHWHPFLADTIRQMAADGRRRAAAFVTSLFGSHSGCRQYLDAIALARMEVGAAAPVIDKLRLAFDHPGFIEPTADALRRALADAGPDAPVLFSAHSIPVAQSRTSPYVDQLREAARLVAERACPGRPWDLVFQSRSGPPLVPWLEPDVNDHLGALRERGATGVVVVPIGFTSDHMEVVYDLDTQARETAERLGLEYRRVPTVGTHPAFVAMIAELVRERTDPEATPRRALGLAGPAGDRCGPSCCPSGRPS